MKGSGTGPLARWMSRRKEEVKGDKEENGSTPANFLTIQRNLKIRGASYGNVNPENKDFAKILLPSPLQHNQLPYIGRIIPDPQYASDAQPGGVDLGECIADLGYKVAPGTGLHLHQQFYLRVPVYVQTGLLYIQQNSFCPHSLSLEMPL